MTEFSKHEGHKNWDVSFIDISINIITNCNKFHLYKVFFHEEHFTSVFDKDQIVYLTSESDNIVENIDQNKVYIIGGLVDHNSQKVIKKRQEKKIIILHGFAIFFFSFKGSLPQISSRERSQSRSVAYWRKY